MNNKLRDFLDGDIPDDVPQWIVQMHLEYDQRDMTPLEAVKKAIGETRQGHCWLVTHVRSGLTCSVDLGREEVVEIIRPSSMSHFQ